MVPKQYKRNSQSRSFLSQWTAYRLFLNQVRQGNLFSFFYLCTNSRQQIIVGRMSIAGRSRRRGVTGRHLYLVFFVVLVRLLRLLVKKTRTKANNNSRYKRIEGELRNVKQKRKRKLLTNSQGQVLFGGIGAGAPWGFAM